MRWQSIAITFFVLCLTFPYTAAADDISLSGMIRQIQVALRDSQKIIAESAMPALSSVELEMKTVQRDVGGGKVSLLIVEVGASQNTSFTSVVRLKLSPPQADAASDVAAASNMGAAIKDAIVAAAAAIKMSRRGNPPLDASSVEIVLRFAVVNDGSGGLKVAFPPFGASLEGKLSQSNVQLMKVTFE